MELARPPCFGSAGLGRSGVISPVGCSAGTRSLIPSPLWGKSSAIAIISYVTPCCNFTGALTLGSYQCGPLFSAVVVRPRPFQGSWKVWRCGWPSRVAIPRPNAYLRVFPILSIMPSTFDFCLPSPAKHVPSGPDWLHEIKYDGYRLRLERDGERVRLITRGGYDLTKRYPWIVESALTNRHRQFVVDGEAVVLGVDGVADFNALHSGRHNGEVQLYAFDCLALDRDDLRGRPLTMRKTNLDRLLARRPDGIFVAQFEQGEIGPDLFRAACNMGLEGLVSKRRDRPYRAGRSRDWIKIKNRTHPATSRVMEDR